MDPLDVLDSRDIPPVDDFFNVLGSLFGLRADPFTGVKTGHGGIDAKVGSGTPVYAVRAGVVTRSGYSQSYGNVIYIRHDP